MRIGFGWCCRRCQAIDQKRYQVVRIRVLLSRRFAVFIAPMQFTTQVLSSFHFLLEVRCSLSLHLAIGQLFALSHFSTTIALPTHNRRAAHAFYRDGLGLGLQVRKWRCTVFLN